MNAATAWIASLTPKFSAKGAFRTIGTMAGAILSHAAFLGFAGSNGQLAAVAGRPHHLGHLSRSLTAFQQVG
jgi:hypothetical protein